MKIQWHGWIQHVASKNWHDIVQSEDFTTVFDFVKKYVRDNRVSVKLHILWTGHTPGGLPRDFMEPVELRG